MVLLINQQKSAFFYSKNPKKMILAAFGNVVKKVYFVKQK